METTLQKLTFGETTRWIPVFIFYFKNTMKAYFSVSSYFVLDYDFEYDFQFTPVFL